LVTGTQEFPAPPRELVALAHVPPLLGHEQLLARGQPLLVSTDGVICLPGS
jgi:hypothetical protein